MGERTSSKQDPESNRRFREDSSAAFSLRVHVDSQQMQVLDGETLVSTFPVSTSRFGIGTTEGSFCTPPGNFCVCEKIGDNAPEGAVFKARIATGEISEPGGDDDLILTRILRLEGCDPENANTYDRFIYIHGTNQEDLIGSPASHGCIRMRNKDILKLYDLVPVGTLLSIIV